MRSYGEPTWRPWVLDEAAAEPIVRRAAEAGISFFDTADVYSLGASEELTGRLLRKTFARREDYVLATKVRSLSRCLQHVRLAVRQGPAHRRPARLDPVLLEQHHYNLLYREEERELIPQCLDMGVGIIPWSPLARGRLAGTRTRAGERRPTRGATDA
jgi:aryl-alcohol dehydrogenase-like predicted oxidoreductase